MPIRKLPPKGSDKLREAIEEYKEAAQRGNIAALDRLALKWGYANRETFERAMRMHTGVYIGQVPTQSYNEDVYRKRMDTLFDATMAIVTLHRNMYPIRKLHILDTGDNSQGENPHQGSNVGSVKMGARDQTTKIVYPAWVKLIGSLKQEFEEVIFEGVPGNHGYERLAPETSREDLRLYDLLKVYFDNVKGVTVNIHEGFAGIVNILGFKCFLFHGDGIPCQQGVPFFALDRKLKSWYMQYGGFNYAFGGHFHKRHSDEIF